MNKLQFKELSLGDAVRLPDGTSAIVVYIVDNIVKCRKTVMGSICDSVCTYSFEHLEKI